MADANSTISPVLALPVCVLGLRLAESHIEEIVLLPPGTALQPSEHPLTMIFRQEIASYLARPDYQIQLPLTKRGTTFQNRVWRAIAAIAPGETRSYGEIATAINSAPRAVGQACGSNPFPIAVPCHRVVGQRSLGGFAKQNIDWLIQTKQWLLAHEIPRK